MAEQYTERPTEIEVFPLGSETDVILRKSIAESETTGENGDVATCWQCEERQIRVPGTVSAEDIAADFEAWWEYTPGTKAQSVEDVRTETVAQMSATCNAAIVGGVDVTLTGGETKHFSLTLEDQLNLLSLQGRVASGADSVPYHADGEECSYYSAADFGRIADAATRWKLYQESYFNALRGYILALETVTELRGVTYGMDIPEAYRTDVLRALLAQQETADVAAECKHAALFAVGAIAYFEIELHWRYFAGTLPVHWTMPILGGVLFLLLGGLNEWLPWEMPFWGQCLLGAAMVTAAEFAAGCVLNLWLGLGVWDYTDMPFNLMGQICLPFSAAWIVVSAAAILLDDWLRWQLYGEDKPHYRWI